MLLQTGSGNTKLNPDANFPPSPNPSANPACQTPATGRSGCAEQGAGGAQGTAELPSLRRHRRSHDGSPLKFQQTCHSMDVPGGASSSELGRLRGGDAQGAEPWGRTSPTRSRWGSITGTWHFFLRSTAALTLSSLQPGRIYFYPSRSVSHGVTKLVKTAVPGCCVACSNSGTGAPGLAAVREVYCRGSGVPYRAR